MIQKIKDYFELEKHGTDIKTELIAGLTTFLAMSYILVVNPLMLLEAGMDIGGVFTATIIASVVATLIMGIWANLPIALSAGMGINSFFVYSVVLNSGYSWQYALTAVLISGLLFMAIGLFRGREAIFNSIPKSLKSAISAGIGLFIALLGLANAGIIQSGAATVVELGTITSGPGLVAMIGLVITAILIAKNVKGGLLIGIILTTIIGIPLGVTILPETFTSIVSMPPSLSGVAFKFVGWKEILTLDMLVIVLTFAFTDILDGIGTLSGVAVKADLLDEDDKLPNASRALMADAVGTVVGACAGTSTITSFVESSAGVAEGGKTGLTAVSTALMFIVALFFAPLFLIVPAAATTPALVIVGLFMISAITDIDFSDYTEAIPAFIVLIFIPFSFSIAEGISLGVIMYVILKTVSGKFKDISWIMVVLAGLFILRIIFTM